MNEHALITLSLFIGFFLTTTSALHFTTKRIPLIPYTSALLVAGLISQLLLDGLGLNIHLALPPNAIYFILLPLLLFESAMKVNIHQFKLQFKTITFLATFGLMLSMLIMGAGLSLLLGYPFTTALLFGAIISATDPIAVLALFKELGAPKRLSLLAEGESMFNDATAVIAFRALATLALAGSALQSQDVLVSLGEFLVVFMGSVIFGAIMGAGVSQIISRIDNDRLVETTLTVATAMLSFIVAEHYFHLSGVISCVVAGITLGNLGRTKISGGVIVFMEELWEYISFIAISLIFFFAAFNLNLELFNTNIFLALVVIALMLVARALSVYISFAISNTLPLFKDEPNVPLKWQHIINWGGMRGVIPLVLVYSLPDSYPYKEEFLVFTLIAFMFTLFINGISIQFLLTALGIHLPKREEEIIEDEAEILHLEEAKQQLDGLKGQEFDASVIQAKRAELNLRENKIKKHLLEIATPEELVNSLRLQALYIEQDTIKKLFRDGYINENVYFDLEAELDLQEDALEYPEVSKGRGYQEGGRLDSNRSFRKRLLHLRQFVQEDPFLGRLVANIKRQIIMDRMLLLRARIISSNQAISHLQMLKDTAYAQEKAVRAVNAILKEHKHHIKTNRTNLKKLQNRYKAIAREFQSALIASIVKPYTDAPPTIQH